MFQIEPEELIGALHEGGQAFDAEFWIVSTLNKQL